MIRLNHTPLWNSILATFAKLGHKHGLASSDLTGTLPVSRGGTGAGDAAAARTNLGAAAASHKHATGDVTGLSEALGKQRMAIYTELNQFGAADQTTIAGIVEKMPNSSILVLTVRPNLAYGGIAPSDAGYGMFIAIKKENSRCTLEYHANSGTNHYVATAYNADGVWMISPWGRLYLSGDLVHKRALRVTIDVPTTGWTYSSAYDSYQKDINVSGLKEGMLVYARVSGSTPGGSFPLIGVQDLDGKVRLSMADVPTRSAKLLITGISEV